MDVTTNFDRGRVNELEVQIKFIKFSTLQTLEILTDARALRPISLEKDAVGLELMIGNANGTDNNSTALNITTIVTSESRKTPAKIMSPEQISRVCRTVYPISQENRLKCPECELVTRKMVLLSNFRLDQRRFHGVFEHVKELSSTFRIHGDTIVCLEDEYHRKSRTLKSANRDSQTREAHKLSKTKSLPESKKTSIVPLAESSEPSVD
ncbi:hypothetical protein ACOME3_001002 [Neoechinorhynchus agilis]